MEKYEEMYRICLSKMITYKVRNVGNAGKAKALSVRQQRFYM